MRFILNFFFFGLLFYLIYLFFPEAFRTLVSWADYTYELIRQLVLRVSGQLHHDQEIHRAFLGLLGIMRIKDRL